MKKSRISFALILTTALGFMAGSANAGIANITPSKDNTLYEYDAAAGDKSNGLGIHLFAGRTKVLDELRRGVLAFDIAGNIPPGSTITSVTLSMNVSRTPIPPTAQIFELHKLLADWGEGTSDATFEEGMGAPATTNDATWRHRFFNTTFWANQGGDFSPTVSASQSVTSPGQYMWSSAQMVADVQSWLDNPATNFGWLVLGDESITGTAKRFDSRESASPPMLTVQYVAGSTPTPTPTPTATATATATPTATATATATPTATATTTATATPTATTTATPTASPSCTPIVIEGSIDDTDPTQTDKLVRSGIAQTCPPTTTCAIFGDKAPHHYDSYTFTNTSGSTQCVTIDTNTQCNRALSIFVAAYMGSFDPNNICTNWIGDSGFSPNPDIAFHVEVPDGQTLVVVVSEVTVDAGCPLYTLTITGLCQGGTPTPTPTATSTATPTATASPTATATVSPTPRPTPTPRSAPTPRPRPTPAPRPA